MLMIPLCNLFDATRIVATGIAQHAMKSKFSKVAYIPRILKGLCSCSPIGGEPAKCILDKCGSGLEKLDQTRIQNAMDCVGKLDTIEKLYEAADQIVENLTYMHEQQIRRLLCSKDSGNTGNTITKNKPRSCTTCCLWCRTCINTCKNSALNAEEASNMQSIVAYTSDTLVKSLTKLNVSKINDIDKLKKFFIRSLCGDPNEWKICHHLAEENIQQIDAVINIKYWDPYEFFRGPCIRFDENRINDAEHTNMNKYGYRKSSLEEVDW
ncbi:unnamed protein product [Rotaria magnacalcarata]|uniref:Uncharacterized protein n=1 Tax=Rotaria magnacalcarata TaxID=392030 RepID=A0A816WMN1_9BILA|nr:unnamed protein product [Rotaria magnacalcarata]CAF4200215.1 unnamed protein product [Rotaria magnacalcarata]